MGENNSITRSLNQLTLKIYSNTGTSLDDCQRKCCGKKCPSNFDEGWNDWCFKIRNEAREGMQDESKFGTFVEDFTECCKFRTPVPRRRPVFICEDVDCETGFVKKSDPPTRTYDPRDCCEPAHPPPVHDCARIDNAICREYGLVKNPDVTGRVDHPQKCCMRAPPPRKLDCGRFTDLPHYCDGLDSMMPIEPPPSRVDTKEECCRAREPMDEMLRDYPISNGYVEQTAEDGRELVSPERIFNLNFYTEEEIVDINARYNRLQRAAYEE